MRQLDPAFAAHIATGVTTLCWCWRVTRRDGVARGFTDHDRSLTFAGLTYEAATGFQSTEVRESLGLSVDNLDVQSAITSDTLTEEDLVAGLYDDAEVTILRVNWAAPDQRTTVRVGTLGEVRRQGSIFSAEIRGLAHYLHQPKGRLFQYTCDADLGDARCGVDLTSPTLRGTGTIVAVVDGRRFTATGLDTFATGWFSRGLARFTSGAADGQAIEVKDHARTGPLATVELMGRRRDCPSSPVKPLSSQSGCDKHLGTCRTKFSNTVNFRGFPHMPGNDFLIRGPGR
ncbi:MAG: DUF2163 domain-containing protein [Rhodospirillales bacterium]|nr:DUF2163 domain-containing protein [Rhodospirillales bacterium]